MKIMGSAQISRRALLLTACAATRAWPANPVALTRVSEGGLQPQIAVDPKGVIHLIYFRGEPLAGDLLHVQSRDGGRTFSTPIKVNTHPGAVVATGSVRGAHLAIGKQGRVHVAWNGSSEAKPKGPMGQVPLLYTRWNDSGTGFEPERNLISRAYGLDGGGTVAAAPDGNIYVFWHAPEPGQEGESHRRIWVARSGDDGKTFSPESFFKTKPTGACGCCGMAAFADEHGNVYALYRSAFENVHRDMQLLASSDLGVTFRLQPVDSWQVGACVMSTEAFTATPQGVLGAWENKGQIYWGSIDPRSGTMGEIVAAPGEANGRKHPALASNSAGDVILAWTEGTGWKRGGSLGWQVYDRQGRIKGERGQAPGVLAFSFAAAHARPDGGFTIVY